MKKNWSTLEKGVAAVLVATMGTYGTACVRDSGTEGHTEELLSKTGADVQALGIDWYELSISGTKISTNLLNEEKRVVGTYVLEPESSEAYYIHITMEGIRGEAVLRQSTVVDPDGVSGKELLFWNDEGSFHVTGQGQTFYVNQHGEQTEVSSDPVNVERLNAIGAEPSVAAVLNDPRFKLGAAIGKDGEFSHAFEDVFYRQQHNESLVAHDNTGYGVSTQAIHGTLACSTAITGASALCLVCIGAALAGTLPTAGAAAVIGAFLCGYICGTSAGLIGSCVWASLTAPTDQQCVAQAANTFPWTNGAADTTADRCVFTCDNVKCNNVCGVRFPGSTGTCQAGNQCTCTRPRRVAMAACNAAGVAVATCTEISEVADANGTMAGIGFATCAEAEAAALAAFPACPSPIVGLGSGFAYL